MLFSSVSSMSHLRSSNSQFTHGHRLVQSVCCILQVSWGKWPPKCKKKRYTNFFKLGYTSSLSQCAFVKIRPECFPPINRFCQANARNDPFELLLVQLCKRSSLPLFVPVLCAPLCVPTTEMAHNAHITSCHRWVTWDSEVVIAFRFIESPYEGK